ALGLEPYQLFTTETLIPESRAREMVKKVRDFQENFQLVEEVEPIACGNLSNIANHSIVGYKVFERKFLRGMFKPFLTRASGDSMFPTLGEGDLILFNRDPDKLQNPDPNKIYLVNLTPEEEQPGLTIKRVGLSKTDWTLSTFPDNRMYPIERHKMNQKRSVLDYVLGIAAWLGKELD
ncbi:MAG: S24 family peptidase, partial [bacterium]|nr:S24 family peptidase [bacterium]